MPTNTLEDCRLFPLRSFRDERGGLAVVEEGLDLSFTPRRIFFLHDISPGASRGGHAHRRSDEVVIALKGQVTVRLFDGNEKREYNLTDTSKGLYLPPMIWIDLYGFTENSIVLALASHQFDESDYIRDMETYLTAAKDVV